MQPMCEQPVAIINCVGLPARYLRTNGGRKLMPDGAARLVTYLQSLFPGTQRKLHVFPTVRRQRLFKATESEKFLSIEERRAASGVERHQRLHLCRRVGNKKSGMHPEEAAPKSAALPRAAQHAGAEVIGIARRGEHIGMAEMRSQRGQRRACKRDVVVYQVHERIARSSHATIGRRRKTLLARAALEAHFRPMCPQPFLTIVRAGIVSNQDFGRLGARGFKSTRRFDEAGQKLLQQGATVPVGNNDTETRSAQLENPGASGKTSSAHTCKDEPPPTRVLIHSQRCRNGLAA